MDKKRGTDRERDDSKKERKENLIDFNSFFSKLKQRVKKRERYTEKETNISIETPNRLRGSSANVERGCDVLSMFDDKSIESLRIFDTIRLKKEIFFNGFLIKKITFFFKKRTLFRAMHSDKNYEFDN